jgi:hypothetical protein
MWRLDMGGENRQVCICADQELKPSETEIVYVVTKSKMDDSMLWRVSLSDNKVGEKTQLYRGRGTVVAVHPSDSGRAVSLITGKDIVIINSDGTKWQTPRVFKMTFPLTCMDVLTVAPATSKKGKKGAVQRGGDIVVGDSVGAIYVLHDAVASRAEITPRKMHWHRMAVSSVKWALDGEYSYPRC